MSKDFELKQHNLNSNIELGAKYTTLENINPIGIAFIKKDLWVAENGSTSLIRYNRKGAFQARIFSVNNLTGLVYNKNTTNFSNYRLLAASEQGTIEGMNTAINPVNTDVLLTVAGGVFYGLDINVKKHSSYNRLYIANFASVGAGGSNVLIYDSTFTAISSFTDPALADAGYAPFNVMVHDKHVYVAFARRDGDVADLGDGFGYIDRFNLDGSGMKRLVNRTGLNAPYGMQVSKCGCYLLVANHGSGLISVYKLKCGEFIQYVKDCHCNDLLIDGLWDITEHCDNLFFTAGINEELGGLVGQLGGCCESSSS